MKTAHPAKMRMDRHTPPTPALPQSSDVQPFCPLQGIGLTPKTVLVLNHAGIRSIADLKACSPGDLLKIRNLGRRSADEILGVLQSMEIELSTVPKEVAEENRRPVKHRYAEEWLDKAVELMRPLFAEAGYPLPAVRVSAGFGAGGHQPRLRKRPFLGECHPRSWSSDGVNEIYITPMVSGSMHALLVLAHELIHAVDDCSHIHSSREFRAIAKAIGHPDYKLTNPTYGKPFHKKMHALLDVLGCYPRSGVKYVRGFPL